MQDLVGLVERPAKRHHHDHVFQPNFIADAFDRFAFEAKCISKFFVIITRRAAQTEHRVLLTPFELLAADELRVFVSLEIAQPHDHRMRMPHGSDPGNALPKFVDEIIRLVFVIASQRLDFSARLAVFQFVEMNQRHWMDLNSICYDEFDAR